jgi:hypothetical protein
LAHDEVKSLKSKKVNRFDSTMRLNLYLNHGMIPFGEGIIVSRTRELRGSLKNIMGFYFSFFFR